ncbi:unnamed protein product [Dovyalis caffra]|uniref:Uncharacterized protein n=1 Tax=Dovyalis caffra TaxID=77055 RepID=A0AAV1RE27_9ROSI|nr:unnamed protein product [Dovyalis caffra]
MRVAFESTVRLLMGFTKIGNERMGAFKLELRCPQRVHDIAIDPEPHWSFDSLSSELNSLEKKLHDSSSVPVPFTKVQSRYSVFSICSGFS